MNREAPKVDSDLYHVALGLLTRRDHSQKELELKLRARFSVSSIELDILFEALSTYGYLNDQRFASAYTRARMRKGFGPERIRMELREKGVADELIDIALSAEELDWSAVAQTVWQKKYRQPPNDLKEKAKQGNFLRYRGFNSEHFGSLLHTNRL